MELPGTEEIKEYVADFRSLLQQGTFPEWKALIRNFVQGIEVAGDEATLTYTILMPSDGVSREAAPVQTGPLTRSQLGTLQFRATLQRIRRFHRSDIQAVSRNVAATSCSPPWALTGLD